MNPQLLLVDDDKDLCQLMQEFFATQGIAVRALHDGREGLQAAIQPGVDLVLLDAMMPGLDGFEVLRQLRQRSQVPVLMLTARTEAASRIRGLESGADDYLPKPFDPLELLARIRAILRRARPEPAGALNIAGVVLDPATRSLAQDQVPIELTSIEFDILEALMRSAGRVVTRDDLSRKLYQRDATAFDRAIDVHVSHLRKKLAGGDALIRTVRGSGYQFALTRETPQDRDRPIV